MPRGRLSGPLRAIDNDLLLAIKWGVKSAFVTPSAEAKINRDLDRAIVEMMRQREPNYRVSVQRVGENGEGPLPASGEVVRLGPTGEDE